MDRPQMRIDAVRRRLCGESVVSICRTLGTSRRWFYYWFRRYTPADVSWSRDRSRAPHHQRRKLPHSVERLVCEIRNRLLAQKYAQRGAVAIQWELRRLGIQVLPGIWTINRHAASILRGLWPGHIVALDSFYVGHLKGVGRVYQLSAIDLCSRYGWAKLYTANNQVAAMDFVEQILIPKFFANGVVLESLLTDNGSEFIGHQFQHLLAQYDIQHQRIPPGKPMLNGYCERFQRTLLEEFYQPIFRSVIFRDLSLLQGKLNAFLEYYNFRRIHFGLQPRGAVPIDVFKAKTKILHERLHKLLT